MKTHFGTLWYDTLLFVVLKLEVAMGPRGAFLFVEYYACGAFWTDLIGGTFDDSNNNCWSRGQGTEGSLREKKKRLVAYGLILRSRTISELHKSVAIIIQTF